MQGKIQRAKDIFKRIIHARSIQFIVATAVFWLLYINRYYFFDLHKAFRWDWLLCLRYFEQGTLFSGQPWCVAQSAVWFSYLWLFKSVVGQQYLRFTIVVLNFLANALVVLMLSNISQQHDGKKRFWMILVLYAPIIYYFYTINNPDITLSTLLFCCAIYLHGGETNRGEIKDETASSVWRNPWVIGMLLALATLIKLSTGYFAYSYVVCWLLLRAYVTQRMKKKKNVKQTALLAFKNSVPLIAPLLVLAAVIIWIYPYYIDYALKIGLAIDSHSFFEVVTQILFKNLPHLNLFNNILYTMLLLMLWYAWKQRDALSISLLLGTLLLFYMLSRQLVYVSLIRFFVPGFALLIVLVLVAYRKASLYGKGFVVLLLFLLITPKVLLIAGDVHKNSIRSLVEYPFHFIPDQGSDGVVLGEDEALDSYKQFLGTFYLDKRTRVEILPYPEPLPYFNPNNTLFRQSIAPLINLTLWEQNAASENKTNNEVVIDGIMQANYSLIIIGPLYWEELLRDVLAAHERNETSTNRYCIVTLPYLEYFSLLDARKHYELLFRNPADCEAMIVPTYRYYQQHFDEICEKSPEAARVLLRYLPKGGITLNRNCDKEDTFLWYYTVFSLEQDYIPYPPHEWKQI